MSDQLKTDFATTELAATINILTHDTTITLNAAPLAK